MVTASASFPEYRFAVPAFTGSSEARSSSTTLRPLDESEANAVAGAGLIGLVVGAVVGGAASYIGGRRAGLGRMEAAGLAVVGAEGGALIGGIATGVF